MPIQPSLLARACTRERPSGKQGHVWICGHKLSAPGGPPDVGRVRSERNTRGGSGSGKGSPRITGQVILWFCRMRRRAHVPRRSQDHLRLNGVDKRRGGWGRTRVHAVQVHCQRTRQHRGVGVASRLAVRRSLGPQCPAAREVARPELRVHCQCSVAAAVRSRYLGARSAGYHEARKQRHPPPFACYTRALVLARTRSFVTGILLQLHAFHCTLVWGPSCT